MAYPIMRGIRKTTKAPFDNRQFLAVKVEDIETNEILTQVLHRKYAEENNFYCPWTTVAGPIVTTSDQDLSENDIVRLGHLVHGFSVKGLNGRMFRLAC